MDATLAKRVDQAVDHCDVVRLRRCLSEALVLGFWHSGECQKGRRMAASLQGIYFVSQEMAKNEEAQKNGDTTRRTALRIRNLKKQLAEIAGGEAYVVKHGNIVRYVAARLKDVGVEVPPFALEYQATGSLASRAWPITRLLALWKRGGLMKSLGSRTLILDRLLHLDRLLAQAEAEGRENEEVELWRAEVVRLCCEFRASTNVRLAHELHTTLNVAKLEEVCARIAGWECPGHSRLDAIQERVVMLNTASNLPEQIRLEEALQRVISQDDKALKHSRRRQQAAAGQLDAGETFYILQGLIEVVNVAADVDLIKPHNWCLNARGVELLAEVQKRIDAACPCQDIAIAAASSWASIAAQKACSHLPARHSSTDCELSDWCTLCWRTCLGIQEQRRTVKVDATAQVAMELRAAALAVVAESSRW